MSEAPDPPGRLTRLWYVAAMLSPFVLIGVGVFASFGVGAALTVTGLALWLDDLMPTHREGRGEG